MLKSLYYLFAHPAMRRVDGFGEDPRLEQKRKTAIASLGDRHVLKGGKYTPENGPNPSFIGQVVKPKHQIESLK